MKRSFRQKGSITQRLVVIILSVALLTGSAGYASFLYWYMSMQEQRAENQANTVALVLSQDLAKLVLLSDLAVAADISTKLDSFDDLEGLVFFDNAKKPVYQFHRAAPLPVPTRIELEGLLTHREGSSIAIWLAVDYQGLALGHALIRFRLQSVMEVFKRDRYVLIGIFLMMLPLSLGLAFITGSKFTRPILDLVSFLEQIERSNQLGIRIKSHEQNEFGQLFAEVNTMLARLELSQTEQRLAAVAFETPSGMFITDAQERILRVNKAFSLITGYSESEVVGKRPALFQSGRHDSTFYDTMHRELKEQYSWSGEIWNRHKNGQIYPESLTIHAVLDAQGQVEFYIAAFNDLTRQKEAEARLRFLSLHDALTGLPNRQYLESELDRFLHSGRKRSIGALVFVDIQQFKVINETLGYALGDQVLIETAKRLQQGCDQARLVARWNSDEFVVWFAEVAEIRDQAILDVEQGAQVLCDYLAMPFVIDQQTFQLRVRLGVALYDHQSIERDLLIHQAASALQQARVSLGRDVVFYDGQADALTQRYVELYRALINAQQQQQLCLHYQIQTDQERRPVAVEALLRWYHPDLGHVSPGEFIPVAERSDLIISLGNWVLKTACAQLHEWSSMPAYEKLVIAVNISGRQIVQDDFVDRVSQLIKMYHLNPARLKLELTESFLVENIEQVSDKIYTLRQMGVCVALDDFGTGYSSLAYLQSLPVSQIKIDQSFVRNLTLGSGAQALVNAILSLGRAFDFEVIAEGVETEEQFNLLKAMGCQRFQGYLLSKPVALEALSIDSR